jgi:protein-tyrosine phosphatase
MQHLVAARGLTDAVFIDSAGTSGYHIGELADPRMRRAAAERGIELTSRSRTITPRDLSEFDLIVVMDRANYREVLSLREGPNAKVRMLSDFLEEHWPREVPDPYYGGDDGFAQVLDMLEAACPPLLDALLGSDAATAKAVQSTARQDVAGGDDASQEIKSMPKSQERSRDPLHGVTLEMMLNYLVERYGWEEMGEQIPIRCFQFEPSIKSSLKFLRQTPWARKRVEDWYAYDARRA